MTIREFTPADWPHVWNIIEPVFRAGETYAFDPEITEDEAYEVWVKYPQQTYVVEEDDVILGTYYIKPNQPALGAHVCNCGYIVGEAARGKGLAGKMCVHSQEEAVRLGFKAMQYNLVVSTNEAAVYLWKKHGFEVVGVLPKAFRCGGVGFVDALVMFKEL